LPRVRCAIYIDRDAGKAVKGPRGGPRFLGGGRKRVLVVLFVPSVERDGTTPVDQARWIDLALETFGRVFGGATGLSKGQRRLAG
jgi:hypothetical protein